MKIKAYYQGTGKFQASNKADNILCERLKFGFEYNLNVFRKRSTPQLNLYRLILDALVFHFGGDADSWNYEMRKKFMPINQVAIGKNIVELPLSTSFASCSHEDFTIFLNNFINWIAESGYDYEELIDRMRQ